MIGRQGGTELAILMLGIIAMAVFCRAFAVCTDGSLRLRSGAHVRVKATGVVAVVVAVAVDAGTTPSTYICRIDNGPDACPRYSEVRFILTELEWAAGTGAEVKP